MKHAMWMWLLAFCPSALGTSCPDAPAKNSNALIEIEHTWARALEWRDAEVLGCILAEEFKDTDPQGSVSDRAATLAKASVHRTVHHELNELEAHVYGDFGYIRGLATAIDPHGKIMARVRFTDIYVYRDGRWQAVAAHESMLPGTPTP